MGRPVSRREDKTHESAVAFPPIEHDLETPRLRFSLQTIFTVSLLFALAFGFVAIIGRNWSAAQQAFFLVRISLWALLTLAYLSFLLWQERRRRRRLGGLIRGFGHLANSRAGMLIMRCVAVATFVLVIAYLSTAAQQLTLRLLAA